MFYVLPWTLFSYVLWDSKPDFALRLFLIFSPKIIAFVLLLYFVLYTIKWNCYIPLGASFKIKKLTLISYVIKIIFFQRHNKLSGGFLMFSEGIKRKRFLTKVRQKIPYERRIKIASPRWAIPPSRASSPRMKSPLINN